MLTDTSTAVLAGVTVIVASVGMIWWGSRPDEVSRPSKRVAALGVSVLALLIGFTVAVRVTSRPAYEATAVFAVGLDDPASRPDLSEERLVFSSPRVSNDAASLDPRQFVWYESALDPAPAIESDLILGGLRIETNAESDEISVHLVADEPAVAWVGANLVVEAYRRVRPEFGRPSCAGPVSHWIECAPLETPAVTSISFASVPKSRIDRPDPTDVGLFALASMLAVYLTWRWWPDPSRSPRFEDQSGVT